MGGASAGGCSNGWRLRGRHAGSDIRADIPGYFFVRGWGAVRRRCHRRGQPRCGSHTIEAGRSSSSSLQRWGGCVRSVVLMGVEPSGFVGLQWESEWAWFIAVAAAAVAAFVRARA